MGGSTARPLTEHVRSHRFNLWHHIYRTWWHSLTCNPSTWEIEKDQKFKAIYRTHQVGDKAGHKRHRLIKNKTTTNTGHYCRDLERIIWKIKTIHVSVRVYMYALATVPMVDYKGSENWSLDVPFSLYLSEWMFLYEFVSVRMNAMYMMPAKARRNTGSFGAAVSAGGSHLTKPWELNPNSPGEPSNNHPPLQLPFGHCIFHCLQMLQRMNNV